MHKIIPLFGLLVLAAFLTSQLPSLSAKQNAVNNCPVTLPPAIPFIPPVEYPQKAPYAGEAWYGTRDLWTVVSADGIWQKLPHNPEGYSQKVFWWRQGYDWRADSTPKLIVTGERLDASAPPLVASKATNAYHPDLGSAMLTGVDIPTLGCWKITGQIEGHHLSFVVLVMP